MAEDRFPGFVRDLGQPVVAAAMLVQRVPDHDVEADLSAHDVGHDPAQRPFPFGRSLILYAVWQAQQRRLQVAIGRVILRQDQLGRRDGMPLG